MSEKKVMIVDDDKNMANAIQRTLREAGFDAYTMNSALEAGVMIEQIKPDVMTLDIKMPDMCGNELLALLKQVPQNDDVKILIISGCRQKELEPLLIDGADDILEKPFENDQLLEKINNLLTN